MSDPDEARRRQEINMFAAMALGEVDNEPSPVKAKPPGNLEPVPEDSSRSADDQLFLAQLRGEDSSTPKRGTASSDLTSDSTKATSGWDSGGSMVLDTLSSSAFDSGSFALSSASSSNRGKKGAAEKSNLDAAVAALSNESDHTTGSAVPLKPLPALEQHGQETSRRITEAQEIPMFAEEVILHRPLFFGAIVPPRVLKEGRSMVKKAMRDLGLDPDKGPPPDVNKLPPSVRNVVGCLRTYGFGLDILMKDIDEEKEEYWRGDPTVSTIQPVWGDEERAKRVKAYQSRRRPSAVTRSITAPARLSSSNVFEFLADKHAETEAGQPSGNPDEASSNPPIVEANNMFSAWLRGGDDAGSFGAGSVGSAGSNTSRKSSEILSNVGVVDDGAEEAPKPLSEQEIFSQWAQGNTNVSNLAPDGGDRPAFNQSTFQMLPSALHRQDSDDDSVIDDELKKQVGINDHLSKAIASLADGEPSAGSTTDETQLVLSRVPQDGSRARPLTNFELTNGCVPLFGADDAPLPSEGDLGVHETKEEQQRSNDQKRSQEIIEKFVAPNVFGSVACPNPASSPDDFHSWNSRATSQRLNPQTSGTLSTNSPAGKRPDTNATDNAQAGNAKAGNGTKQTQGTKKEAAKKRNPYSSRYGWWSIDDDEQAAALGKDSGGGKAQAAFVDPKEEAAGPSLHPPPIHHSATSLHIYTGVEPSPKELQKNNLPLSRLHAATSIAETMPYLADRPASHRFLQIDTQAVGFPLIKTEIEPLFCSLAIYNIETASSAATDHHGVTPMPDLQRCTRVTEALYFDVVNDMDVANRCSGALYPFDAAPPSSLNENKPTKIEVQDRHCGTKCGVFPIPSNLRLSNLFAVLVVRKVLSDESDLDPYIKSNKGHPIDLDKLRASAESASNRHGQFLVPFAFGVAPLLQVFGAEHPVVATSRAVQIPLFRFSGSERQIIDHIMVMLYPRANHLASGVGGPAQMTNGPGSAMLVMRNFGYLGLHAALDKQSNLARDRVVDFSGEIQIRRRSEQDPSHAKERVGDGDFCLILPPWHKRFVAEPSTDGGRHPAPPQTPEEKNSYVQELAPLPLQLSPSPRLPGTPMHQNGPRSRLQGYDSEPFFYTTYSNELLCHPRLLHNCPKGNIVIKVELREVEWLEEISAYVAHTPSHGPSVHNTRRGPFLVDSAYTSCSRRNTEQHFIDEFKMKLPLDARPTVRGRSRTLALLFTVYSVKLHAKSTWKRAKRLFGSASGEATGDSENLDPSGKSRLAQVAAGFLPMAGPSTFIDNGIHDVRVLYKARKPSKEILDKGVVDPSSLVLLDRTEPGDLYKASWREDSFADETTLSNDSGTTLFDSKMRSDSLSDAGSTADDKASVSTTDDKVSKPKRSTEPMSLSVRIMVHSSLHSQNEAISELLKEELIPPLVHLPGSLFLAAIRRGRDFLSSNSETSGKQKLGSHLLEATVGIANHQLCPAAWSSKHFLRIMPVLWRLLVCGTGEPDVAWSNPASCTPIRLHAFSSILRVLGAASLHLTKNGVTQVDGKSAWSVVVFGRVVALLFDELELFGSQALEVCDETYWAKSDSTIGSGKTVSPPAKKVPPKRKRHVRSNFELFNEVHQREGEVSGGSDFFSNVAGALAGSPRKSEPPYTTQTERASVEPYQSSADVFESDGLDKLLGLPPKREVKVDSKSDFQSALRAAVSDDDIFEKPAASGSAAAKNMIQAFSGPMTGTRRWMTAPSNRALSTIREAEDGDDESPADSSPLRLPVAMLSELPKKDGDGEMVINRPKTSKQMRVPKVRKADTMGSQTKLTPQETPLNSSGTLTSDDEIESAGEAFLDVIGKSLGLRNSPDAGGEARHVGSSHHRKTRSRSSIDWTLLGDERMANPLLAGPLPPRVDEVVEKDVADEHDEELKTLLKEESTCVRLPNFVERLGILGKSGASSGRWFPFTYEVIIMTWSAILVEQRRSGDVGHGIGNSSGSAASEPDQNLSQVALRTVGVAVACAPMLFEVIKKSLGFRVRHIFKEVLSSNEKRDTPPLVALEDELLQRLEQIISMVADACIDSRNFDSWEHRQMSIDVNDSVIRFLRDMFSFLAPSCVHRLTLAYFERFVTKDGKHWQDRDSGIGLRCSWEITKLRLNAVTALVRFPDFIRVNGPQMLNWGNWWTTAPEGATESFFDDVLSRYDRLQMSDFVGDRVSRESSASTTAMRPHWLAELTVDICLLGTEHAEQYIQHRSGSLLLELFWSCSQESILLGISAPVACMFLTSLEKIASHVSYISSFAPKNQLRKDVLPCVIFILQAAPANLLRALWRRCCFRLSGKGAEAMYGGKGEGNLYPIGEDQGYDQSRIHKDKEYKEASILEILSLLNLALGTMEYEGCDEHNEPEITGDREITEAWRREYLLSPRGQRPTSEGRGRRNNDKTDEADSTAGYTSSTSRKWQSHDGSLVIVNCGHQIVSEMYVILNSTAKGRTMLNPAIRNNRAPKRGVSGESVRGSKLPKLSWSDVVLFVRAATSLYLHALALQESDVVIVRTLKVTADVIKIFGIKIFLDAIGETLQHWMRVILLHCGGRRAQLRIEATDLLELILRSTWECYGSFFRIRVPLLAVQTEVMERIVATAAARYYRDQRRLATTFEPFSNVSAEASLVPLWRTIDRIEKQPASQNVAFRGALVRMAGKLKKLYRAYVAARVLSFIQSARTKPSLDEDSENRDYETEAVIRANRINILRVINASEGHSKQFLGFQGTRQGRSRVAHFEAVEDALIHAADVFSPTELPEHRVAWLRMLADFHGSRRKYAEEAMCHFHIHVTLYQAARLHGSLWSNTPFLPWTDNIPDPVYIDGDTPTGDPDYQSDFEYDDDDDDDDEDPYGRSMDGANSFRRIFYRVANSVGMPNEDWETGTGKTMFCGITIPQEYHTVNAWISLREMEESMVEQAESAGELFLNAGIIDSCRFAWSLATQYYAEKFNYAKLSMTYGNLARAMVSHVPAIDPSLPQEVSSSLGRFYRVWFHGGAPDSLSGVEFVYRTDESTRLDAFGENLREVIKSIIPDKTPIHLVLDGRVEERIEEGAQNFGGFSRIGPAPLEPVKIKVTPLRPLFDKEVMTRGLPEWFTGYADKAFSDGPSHRTKSDLTRGSGRRVSLGGGQDGDTPHHRSNHSRSYSAAAFSSNGSSTMGTGTRGDNLSGGRGRGFIGFEAPKEGELSGVDKFCFVTPRDRSRGSKEWWKLTTGDYAEKSLKVTQLQVSEPFPACVARQAVLHRLVYSQSPLEAGVDAVSQWCSVLFRTAVATGGMTVLGSNTDPGIGKDAATVVADCIHSSHVKEIGLALLKKNSDLMETDSSSDFMFDYDRLSEDEIKKIQLRLARLLVVFVELLHLLIARNRELLLGVMKRTKGDGASISGGSFRGGTFGRQQSFGVDSISKGSLHNRTISKVSSMSVTSETTSRTQPPPAQANRHHKRALTAEFMRPNDTASQPEQTGLNRAASIPHIRSYSEDQQSSNTVASTSASNKVRTDKAIAVHGELQRAFISLCKSLYPRVHATMQTDTPRWLKQCSQDNYFSLGTYKNTKIPIAEDLCIPTADSLPLTPQDLPPAGYGGASDAGSLAGSSHSRISRGTDHSKNSRFGFGQF